MRVVLRATVNILLSLPVEIFLVALLVLVPVLVALAWIVLGSPSSLLTHWSRRENLVLLIPIKKLILDPLAGAALAGLVLEELRHRGGSVRASLALFGRRSWRTLGAHLLLVFPFIATVTAVLSIGFAFDVRLPEGVAFVLALLFYGSVLACLAIAGIVPIIAQVEATRPWKTIRRALSLARGTVRRLMGLGIVVLLGELVPFLLLMNAPGNSSPGYLLLMFLAELLVTMFVATMAVVTYCHLLLLEE